MLLHNELQSFTWVPLKKHLADCSMKQGATLLNLTCIFEKTFTDLYIH